MSIAFARKDLHLVWLNDYEPVSDDGSRTTRQMLVQDRNYRRGSASDWSPIIEAALLGIRNECSRVGWDGDDALPISNRTIDVVAKLTGCLFTLLPRGTPAPDLIPEPDGEICISWLIDADRMFSVSVGAHGKINFSGQFGKEGALHAWQPIDPKNRASLEESLQDVARFVGRLYPPPSVRRVA
jgi:hypothetical protein